MDIHGKKTIWCASRDLSAEVVLNVHLVVGPELAVFIDSGISSMYDDLLRLIGSAGVEPSLVKLIVNTHSHHDHIGCNGRLQARFGCLVGAPEKYARWHSDFDYHYEEFANGYRDIIEDDPVQRKGILATLDMPHHVSLHLGEGSKIALGGGVELVCLEVPGHMEAEVGFLETSTGVLLLGDVFTGTTWSFFHGYVNVAEYRGTLGRLGALIGGGRVQEVHAAHYPALDTVQASGVVAAIARLMDDVEGEVLDIVRGHGSATTSTIWQLVCDNMKKDRDFRALNVVTAHIQDLVAKGRLVEERVGVFCEA